MHSFTERDLILNEDEFRFVNKLLIKNQINSSNIYYEAHKQQSDRINDSQTNFLINSK